MAKQDEQVTELDPRDTLIESLTQSVQQLLENQETLQSQLDSMQTEPARIPTIGNQTGSIEPGTLFNEYIAEVDTQRQYSFEPGDIVMLKADTDKCKNIVTVTNEHGDRPRNAKLLQVIEEGGGIPGRVITYKQTDKHGEQKFQVMFEGIGKDSCRDSELTLIRRGSSR
jgi:hypothetical protein|tara:strand:- start:609 stop:1115 length:507 start_codon:yes stop_codon:yes gene_type:complete